MPIKFFKQTFLEEDKIAAHHEIKPEKKFAMRIAKESRT